MDCHQSTHRMTISGANSIALVGQPNVGKSVLFQRLTGQRVTVSNYPGTTVEIARAAIRDLPDTILVDTPGVIAFPPKSDDEQVTERLLLNEPFKAVLQVGDGKNLRRTLLFTVQLAEMGVPLVLALNMMDEADARGVVVQHSLLAESLGIPVVPTTAIKGRGVDEIRKSVLTAQPVELMITYPPAVEDALKAITPLIPSVSVSARSLAILWLSGDTTCETWLSQNICAECFQALIDIRTQAQRKTSHAFGEMIQQARIDYVQQILDHVLTDAGTSRTSFSTQLGSLATHPLWGVFILLMVLYGLYWFVGIFGAGVLVGLLEENLFGEFINPWLTRLVLGWIPVPLIADLLVGEYGLWTMGMTYALALILPIVGTFFLAFGVLEDSGYLPRLAALSNHFFSAIGLNGKAVLPMVLGLGCVTMGTITTRVLESKRERLLVTLLLALAIPCSAQLGVVMGMLGAISLTATLIWGGVVLLILLGVGWLAAQLVPGERTQLLVELPPMRMPAASNIILKTIARLEWYLKEVVPLFLIGTAILFVLDKTLVLAQISELSKPLVTGWLGLPSEVSTFFLMGFLRRDFGAAGLFDLQSKGLLSPAQVIVAMVTITLFIPCIASVMMISKERNWRVAIGIVVLVFTLAILVGGLVYRLLLLLGWS